MKIFAIVLAAALILLQYHIWLSGEGMREVSRLQEAVGAQKAANRIQGERNRQLAAEVADLKGGMTALEERARSELGMVGSTETFYQVVSASAPAPEAPVTHVSARAN